MIKKFFRDETGLELSEYAVAAALVAIAVVGAFSALGGTISGKIDELERSHRQRAVAPAVVRRALVTLLRERACSITTTLLTPF